MANKGLLLAGAGVLAYLTRNSWLPQAETAVGYTPTDAGASMVPINQPGASTGSNQAVGASTPGAVALGNGCYQYTTSTMGAGAQSVISCPPGVNPPATTQPNDCASGFTRDAAGICTRYPDAVLLAQLNTIHWTGLSDIPAEQINRIDPLILQMYSGTTGVNAGTALAYMLGLGDNPIDGAMMNGSDGNAYKALGGVFYLQGNGTRLNGLRGGSLAAALPITNATLIMASVDPQIAALVGRDPRAMLTVAQWNFYYAQASGVLQAHDAIETPDPHQLISAADYQALRRANGLEIKPRMGTLRQPAHRGAFPLGAINQWVPPGNRTIFQLPGRGAVPAGRGGQIPPRRHMGLISDGGGDHRSARSPFPRPDWWREYRGEFRNGVYQR